MDTDDTTNPSFTDYVRAPWSRRWLILIAVVVATGGVYAYYSRQAKVYGSTTLVFVKDPGDPVSGDPSPQLTDRSVQNQAVLLHSREVAAAAGRDMGFTGTPAELLARVSITSREGEDFVNITAHGDTAQQAADIANSYARQFIALVNTSQISRIRRALSISRDFLRHAPHGPAAVGTRQSLGDQIRRLELALKVPPGLTKQIDRAVAPSGPSEPKPVHSALFAFALSLMLSISAAFAVERLDRRLKQPTDVRDAYGRPILTVIPHSDDPTSAPGEMAALSPEFREAFRLLRMNIELARLDAPPRTIVVSSAVPGEGKSLVVRNLALAFRETGASVAVVEGDLRRPALGPLFGVRNHVGLTDVLARRTSLGEAAVHVGTFLPALDELERFHDRRLRPHLNGDVNGAHRAIASHSNGTSDRLTSELTLLLSSGTPANPLAVLKSERFAEILDELRDSHDVVLIDSAPLLAVADSVPLLRYADATILVGRMGFTSRDQVKRVVEFLNRIPDADILGIVANDLSKFEAVSNGYGDYGYSDGEQPDVRPSADETSVCA